MIYFLKITNGYFIPPVVMPDKELSASSGAVVDGKPVEIKQWIYRWLPHVEIKAPRELKEIVAEELTEALQRNR